jgi:hypothetical protein
MISTFTITLCGAFVARLLQEMAAVLCGSVGMSMVAATSSASSAAAMLPRNLSANSPRSRQLLQVINCQFPCPVFVGINLPVGEGKYGFIGHVRDWLTLERRKIRSKECRLSLTLP